jgi:hypothetical protein
MMRAWIVAFGLGLGLSVAAAADGPAAESERLGVLRGACYCRMAQNLECSANLTERDCHRQCDAALCDDWFWKERLPCWNWGYGG